jgi:hypothetical protein
LAAAFGALSAFACAACAAVTHAIPQFHVYDGYRMLLWSGIALMLTAPLAWRRPRERGLIAIGVAGAVGCWLPIVYSAFRYHLSLVARLRGAWTVAGGDIVGLAMPVGAVLAWLAIREHAPAGRTER